MSEDLEFNEKVLLTSVCMLFQTIHMCNRPGSVYSGMAWVWDCLSEALEHIYITGKNGGVSSYVTIS